MGHRTCILHPSELPKNNHCDLCETFVPLVFYSQRMTMNNKRDYLPHRVI